MTRPTIYDAVVEITSKLETDTLGCLPIRESKRPPCDLCGTPMEPEHAHYRCSACHYILPCCGW